MSSLKTLAVIAIIVFLGLSVYQARGFAAWEKKQEQKTTDKNRLNTRFYSLRSGVKDVEKIQRSVHDILREEQRETQRTRKQDMER